MIRMKDIPADYVHTLTITEYVIGECPSELARLLQLLPHLRTFRMKGNREWQPPLNCGRLISFNGMLHKTLSSKSYNRNLEEIEIHNMSITQIVIDVIAAIPRYTQLKLIWSQVLHEPDLMTTTLCNPTFLQMDGDNHNYKFGNERWMYHFLRTTKIAR